MTRALSNPIRTAASSLAVLLPLLATLAHAQGLGSNCTATLLNHSVQINDDGTYNFPNVPYNPGLFRVHVVCTNPDGTTSGGQSDPLAFIPNGAFAIPIVSVGPIPPALLSIIVRPDSALLSTSGATTQINVIATLADGTSQNYSADPATTYTVSNPALATVSASGLLTAVGAGVVTITARNDGLVATTTVNINALIDTDGDGIPDAWEIAHGLNPYDPTDAAQDPDNDGLTNLQEYLAGTDPHVADTDGDGLTDGQEVKLGTNPLVADTDGDGLTDGQEVALGTNPLLADTDGDGIPDGIEVKLGTNPLVADPTTTVTGRVLDGNNKPVAGASASVLQYFNATTDATGSFTLINVPTDVPSANGTLSATILAVINGSVQNGASNAVAPVPSGLTDLGVIQLGASTGVVTGTVSNTTGKVIAGAQVTVSSPALTLTTTTNASGVYTVTNLTAGAITVSSLDPATGLRGQVNGTLLAATSGQSNSLTLNLRLGGYGSVAGSVLLATGVPAAAGVTVSLSGSTLLTTTTGPLGAFSFPFVPLGAFTVQASDTAGDTGSNTGFVATTNETITANIQFLGNGNVSGRVADAANNPAVNATVTLLNSGATPQKLTTQTDSSGHYSLSGVFVGSFAVSAGYTGTTTLAGTTMASLNQQGQSLTVNITVTAAGTAHGLVVRAGTQTPAAGVTVRAALNAISTTTDSTGAYTLAFIPAGNVTLMAADPASGDQGSVAATITAGTTNNLPNLTLNGTGTINVTVTDASGTPVPSAQLTLTSDSAFTQQLTGLSAADGTYTFLNALVGPITVMATNPVNELAGTAQATATLNATVNVAVQLQPAGTISGIVFAADGQTPAPGVNVQFDGSTTTLSAANGAYSFATVPAGSHLVVALDGQNIATSPTVTATIATQGQTVTANLILISRATVTGTILNPDATPASGASVSVQSLTPGFVRALSAQADVNGNYTIANVPTGPIALSAYTSTASGQATATLPASGTTVNLTLVANQTRANQTFYDANAAPYDIDQTGEIASGLNSVFAGIGDTPAQQHSDTLLLTLESTGIQSPFTGAAYGTALQAGQEIAIQQNGLFGLNITRRVYVPSNGYLARYLEVFTNPTASDIVLTVGLRSGFRYTHESRNGYDYQGIPEINATSSGDASFNITGTPSTTDRWVVEGVDEDLDPYLNTATVPSVGYLFDDGNGSVALTSGDFFSDTRHGQLDATWQHIRIPANSTVELMHFTSQAPRRAGAQAAVQRLIQLPPEALSGLSPADASAILNFHVPTNLTSTVPALPTLTGQISGLVVAGDNTTPITGAIVSVQSTDPLYARTYNVTTDGTGSYNILGNVTPGTLSTAYSIAIPLEGFNVFATHPVTAVLSPTFLSAIDPTVAATAQNIVFSNTGQQMGTVRFNGTTIVTSGTVTVASTALPAPIILPIQPDGTYALNGLPVGNYTATAAVSGTFLTGLVSTAITSGITTTADIFITSGGTLTGHVLGSDTAHTPLPNITVYLRLTTQTLSAVTDSSGTFTFTDVPAGTYALQAYDPVSNTAASATTTVTAPGTTTQNITLSSTGSVNVQVNGPGTGVSVASLTVTLSSGTQILTAITNSAGFASFTAVPVGPFAVSATAAGGFSGTATGTLGLAGQTAAATIVLGPHGIVNGTIFNADGVTPAPGLQVQLYGVAPGAYIISLLATTRTDANGAYLFNTVPVGGFTINAQNATTGDAGSASGTLAVASQQVTLNFNLTGLGTVTVTVLHGDQTPDSGVQVTANSAFNSTYTATTNVQGTATLTGVLAGSVRITASDPLTQLSGNATVTLNPGSTAAATITLQSTENITGHVYLPLKTAVAPAAQLQIYLFGTRYPYATATSKPDGSFTFTGVPLGTYVINVYDPNGVFRTYANLTLSAPGTTVTQDLTYVGLGTVKGTVSNPDATAASGIAVSLTSQTFSNANATVYADQNGNYTIPNVPVGGFQVNAQDLNRGVGASASGTVTSDGDIETVNLQLVSNVVSLTKTLTDFNNFPYDVQADGSIANGVFVSDPLRNRGYFESYNNAFHLSLYQSGNKTDFTGAPTGITTLNGRQIAIAQVAPIAGLNVTRKVFVPADGYFARYLELLANPTTAPITVDVQVSGGVQYPYPSAVTQTTSSGDATLSTADTTLVTISSPLTAPYPYNQAALGEAFEGPAAPTPISVANYVIPNSTNGLYYPQLTYRWNTITIPAGGQVGFLHFATQQTAQGQAVASVARLDQLPPEGLNGLTTAELASITNFAIPAGGTSQLQPLTVPGLGSVTGHVYATDAATLIPGAEVVVSGNDLYLGATKVQLADANGQFNFTQFPIANYTLTAIDPYSFVFSPASPGTFTPGSANSSTNIVFTNTGTVSGTVFAPVGTTYTSAVVLLVDAFGNTVSTSINVAADGTFTIPDILPGTYTLQTYAYPNLTPSQGTSFLVTQPVTVTAAQTTTVTVNLPQTATLTGTFLNAQGQPEVNAYVNLQSPTIGRSIYTDANGAYTFPEVPYGTYTLTGYEVSSSLTAAVTVSIASPTITQNLQIATGGTINLNVTLASGTPAPNSLVTITRSGALYGYITAGVTDGNGNLQITTQPIGAFTVTAFYPGEPNSSSSISVKAAGSVTSNGQTVPVTATFPATSTVTGTVTSYSGAASPGAQVALNYTNSSTAPYRPSTTASSTGTYTFTPVVAGLAAQLQANLTNNYTSYSVTSITTPASGATLTQNLKLPVSATVIVTAVDANSNPIPNTFVFLQSTSQSTTSVYGFSSYQQTTSTGTATYTQVPDAAYSVTLYDTNAAKLLGSTTATVHTTDDGNTVNITVQTGFTGTITGTLVAADGITPVPSSRQIDINLTDTNTGTSVASVVSTDGTFNFPGIAVGTGGYTLTVQYISPSYTFNSYANTTLTGSFTANNQTQVVNPTLPIPVLTGTVTDASGNPVPNPSITVTAPNYSNPITFYGISNATGSYSVALPINDEASIVANANGLSTLAQYYVHSTDTIDTQNIVLQPSGTVTGTVSDTSGNPLSYIQVSISSDAAPYTLYTTTDNTSTYSLTGIATGNITVTATYYNNSCTGTAAAPLVNNGDTLTLNITVDITTCTGAAPSAARLSIPAANHRVANSRYVRSVTAPLVVIPEGNLLLSLPTRTSALASPAIVPKANPRLSMRTHIPALTLLSVIPLGNPHSLIATQGARP